VLHVALDAITHLTTLVPASPLDELPRHVAAFVVSDPEAVTSARTGEAAKERQAAYRVDCVLVAKPMDAEISGAALVSSPVALVSADSGCRRDGAGGSRLGGARVGVFLCA
jgi:hypothetical protein